MDRTGRGCGLVGWDVGGCTFSSFFFLLVRRMVVVRDMLAPFSLTFLFFCPREIAIRKGMGGRCLEVGIGRGIIQDKRNS